MNVKHLHIEIRVGEYITIDGGRVVLRLIEKSGQRARFHCTAPEDVRIDPVRERPGEPLAVIATLY